jgi:hypothetical protein
MSEEKISKFAEELTERSEPMPQDLIKKYRDQGVPDPEMAAAILARQALAGPAVPESALERSQRRISEMAQQSGARPAGARARPGLLARIRRLLHMQ